MQSNTSHPYARRLAQDLFDALWLEDLYGFRKHCRFHSLDDGDTMLEVALDEARSLLWYGRRAGGLRPFRVSDRPVVLHIAHRTANRALIGVVEALQTAEWWDDRTGRFARFFALAYDQAALAAVYEPAIMARATAAPDDLLSWEAVSCLKDRPFHPLARAKDWDESDGAAYLPETGASFALHWVALPRDRVLTGSRQTVSDLLLDGAQQEVLADRARARGADSDAYLWLPVHPWQWERLNRTGLSNLTDCIDLGTGPGSVMPTASLRSLAVIGRPSLHLKLALSVNDWLAALLRLCDENDWCVLRQRDALQAEPGELACMIRRYPTVAGATFIPMAALPATSAGGTLPAFDHLIGLAGPESKVWALFADIARALLELGLRCFAYGVMPELHGQNVVLAFQGQRIAALVLRDHDTLRICSPLMRAQGIAAPDYVIDRSTPNTLELNTPRELLAYLQTLAIEVNLYAILAALAERYRRDESHGWHIVRTVLEDCLVRVPLPNDIANETRSLLLDEPDWPFKQVLAPLLGRASFGTGMPSAMGRLSNPLLPVECIECLA
ncbi:MAG: siderophore biosynthesis protein [Paucimonas sp.]|nr:siderophore biosynthesis protein [Paucimonas sp.]